MAMMRSTKYSLAVVLTTAVSLVVCNAYAGINLTPKETQQLAAGWQVRHPLPSSGKNSVIAGTSFILINAPVDKVWNALNEVPAWSKIFPNTFSCKAVASKGNSMLVKMKIGNRFFTFDFFLTIALDKQKKTLSYDLNKDKPADIEEARGKVRLFPQPGGRTLVVFTTLVKVPFGAIISLMGDKIVRIMEERILSVPKSLKKRFAAAAKTN